MTEKNVNWKVEKYLSKNTINLKLLEESPNTAILTIFKSWDTLSAFFLCNHLNFGKYINNNWKSADRNSSLIESCEIPRTQIESKFYVKTLKFLELKSKEFLIGNLWYN